MKSPPTDCFVQRCSGKQLHFVAKIVGAVTEWWEKSLSKQAGFSKITFFSLSCAHLHINVKCCLDSLSLLNLLEKSKASQ